MTVPAYTFSEFVFQWAPSAFGSLLTLTVGIWVRRSEKRRQKDDEAARRHWEEIKTRVSAVQRQNGWFIRKFVELATMHNSKHADSHITIDDYPNGYNSGGEG